ncbi:MAG: hypothetical protein COW01_14170 [Bdellovibrionales bacterium CG12_big_fil_rev_8_21_14_0_65_38_15]|nr:MAG: hypothetical protein COW79_16990 [Bdellovibrionales bacterium CG22_combo_CG10-13_8_21_14_all_38_13]PIQ53419.1 MAG: hypothetical protein COW01_14170 [Bdellovibrionales bacterium CG12_big_fil_rev_8_21_14_0_65_38_15]PIR30218.1 MAG: hypothetical protein COV38_05585 [Bdellovibrionales bacterium CG11_big_fil_rev_8_21_14_0_20_38_13]
MKNVIILSATTRSNLQLSKDIASHAPDDLNCEIVVIEEMNLPLYCPQVEEKGIPPAVTELVTKMSAAGALILVAPEYNGSIPPVMNNLIAWISRASKEWRQSFAGKFAAVATMSGGGGAKVLQAMRSQLEHLGTTVHSHALLCTGQKPLNPESAKKIMSDFSHWLR